jgi:hypothetical protein
MITKPRIDVIFLGLLGVLLASTFIQAFLFSYVIDWHHYAALLALLVVVVLHFSNSRFKRHGTLLLLGLGSISILNFTTYKVTVGFRIGVVSLVVDLLFSVLFLIYVIIHRQAVVIFFKGTEQEVLDERNGKIEHYRKIFSKCSTEELQKIKRNISEYPEEARAVLNELGDN